MEAAGDGYGSRITPCALRHSSLPQEGEVKPCLSAEKTLAAVMLGVNICANFIALAGEPSKSRSLIIAIAAPAGASALGGLFERFQNQKMHTFSKKALRALASSAVAAMPAAIPAAFFATRTNHDADAIDKMEPALYASACILGAATAPVLIRTLCAAPALLARCAQKFRTFTPSTPTNRPPNQAPPARDIEIP